MAVAVKTDGVRWNLDSYFTEFNGTEMLQFKDAIKSGIADLQQEASKLEPLNENNADIWESVILRAEDISARMGHISSYVNNLSSAHADRPEYAQELGRLSALSAEYDKLDVELLRAFKDATEDVFQRFLERPKLADASYYVRRLRQRAQWTMSIAEEQLAAELSVDGLHSWGRLYDTITGKLKFQIDWPDGRIEELPISQWRSLMGDVDRNVGRAAFEGGNRAWAEIADTCAAALNAISGTRLTLYRHRGIDDFMQMALFQSGIERKSLDAMYSAIHANLDKSREIFRLKSRALNQPGIWFFEREAPLPLESGATYNWEDGSALVTRSFRQVYPKLADYYEDFLRQGWMESEVRPNKRPGAYCTGSSVTGEQRVYMTFNGSLSEVSTIAHELGHAWHGHLLKGFRPVAQRYPMTLAETASIFAEQILAEGVYEDESVSSEAKLQMLDADLCGAAVLLLDITVRFEFEKALYEERAEGEVSVERMKELMIEKQREVLGDALVEGGEDPYFWASKLHFYITRTTFYNFPYTFGFLLARTLFARFKQEGDAFLERYEDFLRLTGRDSVENVVKQSIGGDTTDPAFWQAALDSLNEPLKLYGELLQTHVK